MNFIFNPPYQKYQKTFEKLLFNFKNEGILIGTDKRNAIKYFDIDGDKINIKSFKSPNFVNKIVYRYFRKSKARRSFEFAQLLLNNGFGTPEPMAYLENYDTIGLTSSYYFSRQKENVFMFRVAIFDTNFKDREQITRAYTRFFFNLHEKGIEFVDNTSGNTLIEKTQQGYSFYLVDLNRMNFHNNMSIKQRIENFSKLTLDISVLEIIADEYAKLMQIDKNDFSQRLQTASFLFQSRLHRRKNLKKKFFFWK
jgi:hypothetical protein